MQQVLILTGISGSGKSTFAKQFCKENQGWLRINRDDLRRSVLGVSLNEYWQEWTDKQKSGVENLINDLQKTAIREALQRGWHLIIDNTHLKLTYINQLVKILDVFSVEIRFKLIEIDLEEAIARDKNRTDVVGEQAIREQFDKLQLLKKNFDFSQVITKSKANFSPTPTLPQNENLPKCILVDIDGTVADKGKRIAFEWLRVGEDTPKTPIINLVKALKKQAYEVIFFSGRDSVCRDLTVAWLNQHFSWQESVDYQLFMRAEKDQRKDSIVKKELFELHIKDKYFVEAVIDDRDQVVAMWRKELGLTCLQVDYGDF
ncbi:MAG: AAA family ATPase [Verrucomicrobia bacterium]|nr:AAA family ATPase [Cytophagales bacterium]